MELERRLLALGFSTDWDAANNLYAYLPGEGPTILLNAHMDTVEPGRGIKPIIEDGIIRSDGTTVLGADDKAALAAILEALRIVKERDIKHPNLVVLITTCEEQGLLGAAQMDVSKLASVDYGFTFDAISPVGGCITSAPSHIKLEVEFLGRKAHAGFCPETGISAIQMASEAISRMKLLRIDEETTANVGSFLAPGAKNIVCDKARLIFEARSLSTEKLENQIADMKWQMVDAAQRNGGTVDITETMLYEEYRHTDESPAMEHFKKACTKLQLPFSKAPTLGGSDANILNAKGIPTVVCTTGYEKPHSTEEYIPIAELENLGALVLELITL